jgi:hypothetical protein
MNPVPLLIVRESGGGMYQKGTGGNNGSGLACYVYIQTGELVRGPTRVLLHNFRTKDIDRDRLCGFVRSPLACRMYQKSW